MVRVLIVEDEPLARFVGRRSLEDLGFLVIEAETCMRALELAETISFDAVIMDHRLPDGFGIDVIRRLRTDGRAASVVYLSAESEQITPTIQEELKLDAVLTKPVGADDLKNVMEVVVRRRGEQDAKTADAQDEPTYRGRFFVVVGPNRLMREAVVDLQAIACNNPWLGLDLSATEDIEEGVESEIVRLAAQCREKGGRLCLVGLKADLERGFRATRMDRECDLLATMKGLESHGRRLSAACERASLLDSVVLRDGEGHETS